MATHKEIGYPGGVKRQRFAPAMKVPVDASEADFQQLVSDTASMNGWRHYHTHNSLRSDEGFPDLVMVRGRRMVVVELKRVGKSPTMAQVRWLLAMAMVPGVECYAWDETDTDTMLGVLA